MQEKIDFKKSLKAVYGAKKGVFEIVRVPDLQFLMVDGAGNPNTSPAYAQAVASLYAISYAMKFFSKLELKRDYVVPPLEGLWWADDMDSFGRGDKDDWLWTMMIMVPDWLDQTVFELARSKAETKLGTLPQSLRIQTYAEGLSVQTLHIGPYSQEADTIAQLHQDFLPRNGLVETGHHHEIYLSDPRKVAPEKLKTILRQPVQNAGHLRN